MAAGPSSSSDNPSIEQVTAILSDNGLNSKWKSLAKALGLQPEAIGLLESSCLEENRLRQMLIQLRGLSWIQLYPALENVGEVGLSLQLRMENKFLSNTKEPPAKRRRIGSPTIVPECFEKETFVNPSTAQKYSCVHCKKIPFKSFVSHCSHAVLSCESCTSNSCLEPDCNFTKYKYDGKTASKIRKLKIKCIHEPAGCKEKFCLSDLEKHLGVCVKQQIVCEYNTIGCCELVPREDMENHLQTDHFSKAVETITSLREELKSKKDKEVLPVNFQVSFRASKSFTIEESPVVYSCDKGYKLQAHVGVLPKHNGGGMLKLIVRALPGDYDANLQWPLVGSLRLVLLNTTANSRHRVMDIDLNLAEKSATDVRNFPFQPASDYSYNNDGETCFHFCIMKLTLANKPWLTNPAEIYL